jgi:hypothetical protein
MDKDNEENPSNWVGRSLDYCYDLALNSTLGGIQKNCFQLAEDYQRRGQVPTKAVDNLIAWQCAKTGLSGFANGLPGLLAMPVTVPLDLTALWYVQLRMVAATALIFELDPKEDRVRTLCYASLLGSGAQEALGKVGVTIATKSAEVALRRMPGSVLAQINKAVGFRLATKFGQKGAINLVKLVPIAGGLVGGTINAVGTRIVGSTAKRLLQPNN